MLYLFYTENNKIHDDLPLQLRRFPHIPPSSKSEPEVLITTLSRSALSRELRSLGKRGLADVGDPVLYLSLVSTNRADYGTTQAIRNA